MRSDQLLRLYPRAWRERYGEEFVSMTGPGALGPQQVIDIVSGAIDAWLSADVRDATRAYGVAPTGGGPMTLKSMMVCGQAQMRYTTRDSLIGAGVMIGATLILSVLGIEVRRAGWPQTGEVLTSLAFFGGLTLSMPFWLMKGQPWKAQVAIAGTTFALVIAAGFLATVL
jgi:hypothetical protein